MGDHQIFLLVHVDFSLNLFEKDLESSIDLIFLLLCHDCISFAFTTKCLN